MKGFKVPEATHPDWPALILIDQIVGADKTGRLYRALEDKGKASATFSFCARTWDPGLFVFGAYLTPEAEHEEVETIMLEEIDRLGGRRRHRGRAKASKVRHQRGNRSMVETALRDRWQINDAIATGDWKLYTDRPKDIAAVSAEEIREVAERYFKEDQQTPAGSSPKRRIR